MTDPPLRHRPISFLTVPSLLLPRTGTLGLLDYEKAFAPDFRAGQDVFELRGIDREQGCMVVVRPDQYVAHVLPLDGFDALSEFFSAFLLADRSLSETR